MGVRIAELPETTGIKKEDVLIVEDGQGTKKGTVQQLDEALGVSQLKEDIVACRKNEDFNYLPSTYLANSAFYGDGSINSNAEGYLVTDYIKVNHGDMIVAWSNITIFDDAWYYDSNKNKLSSFKWPFCGVVPEGASYIRLMTRMSDYPNSYLHINPLKIEIHNANIPAHLRVVLDTHYQYFNGRELEVILNDGTYDIASTFAADEINSADYTETAFVGLNIGDGIRLKGSDKSRVILSCNIPTTYNAIVRDKISTLNIRGNCTLENLTVTSTNIRYPVHDDYNGGTNAIHNIINCDFYNYINASGSTEGMGYGLGTRSGGILNFTNCFISPCFIYHNNSGFSVKSIVNMFNCNVEKTFNLWDFESGVDCFLNLFGVTYESFNHTLNGEHEKRIKINDYVHGVNAQEKAILDLFKNKTITFNENGTITWS